MRYFKLIILSFLILYSFIGFGNDFIVNKDSLNKDSLNKDSLNKEYILNQFKNLSDSYLNRLKNKPSFYFQLIGNINYNKLNFNSNFPNTISKYQTGYLLGLGISKSFKEKFEISVDFNYVFNRSYIGNYQLYLESQIEERFNWLDIPFQFKYKYSNPRYKPFVTAGFSFDYLLNSSYTIVESINNAQYLSKRNYELLSTNYYQRFVVMYSSGIGIEYERNSLVYSLSLLYKLGLIKPTNSSDFKYLTNNADYLQNFNFFFILKIPKFK